MGFIVRGLTFSPIKGPQGNIEYLAYLADSGEDVAPDIAGIVAQAHTELD
jgi:23S rRNA (cytidine1920-2'-O)/16S rRNA (cytidine1409-2'-O)-methyltransferase